MCWSAKFRVEKALSTELSPTASKLLCQVVFTKAFFCDVLVCNCNGEINTNLHRQGAKDRRKWLPHVQNKWPQARLWFPHLKQINHGRGAVSWLLASPRWITYITYFVNTTILYLAILHGVGTQCKVASQHPQNLKENWPRNKKTNSNVLGKW